MISYRKRGNSKMNSKNMLTTIMLSIFIISAIAVMPLSIAQQNTNLIIDPPTTQLTAAQVGSTINVNLTVNNVQNLFAWSLNLTWNPLVLNLTQMQEGPFLSNAGSTLFTWSPGLSHLSRPLGYIQTVSDALLSSATANGNGVLVTISFKVLNTGTSQISIEGTILSSPAQNGAIHPITTSITDGIVEVSTSNANPTPTSSATATTTSTPTPITATQTPTSTTQVSGSPTHSPTTTPATPEFPTITIILAVLIMASAGLVILAKNKTTVSKK